MNQAHSNWHWQGSLIEQQFLTAMGLPSRRLQDVAETHLSNPRTACSSGTEAHSSIDAESSNSWPASRSRSASHIDMRETPTPGTSRSSASMDIIAGGGSSMQSRSSVVSHGDVKESSKLGSDLAEPVEPKQSSNAVAPATLSAPPMSTVVADAFEDDFAAFGGFEASTIEPTSFQEGNAFTSCGTAANPAFGTTPGMTVGAGSLSVPGGDMESCNSLLDLELSVPGGPAGNAISTMVSNAGAAGSTPHQNRAADMFESFESLVQPSPSTTSGKACDQAMAAWLAGLPDFSFLLSNSLVLPASA